MTAGAARPTTEPLSPQTLTTKALPKAQRRRARQALSQPKGRWRGRLIRDGLFALAALGLAVGVRALLVQPYHIAGGSMTPTLLSGDYVLVGKYAYAEGAWAEALRATPGLAGLAPDAQPRRGDIVVFANALDEGRAYVKRVVGVPGDTIAVADGAVVLNGRRLPHEPLAAYAGADDRGRPVVMTAYSSVLPGGRAGAVRHNTFQYRYDGADAGIDDMPAVMVPPGRYFVMGDNRDASVDSRRADRVGLVPEAAIVGRVERVAVSTTPGFGVFDPRRWGELRADRLFARVDGEMRP